GPVQPVALDFEIDRLGQAVPQHLDVGAVGGRLSGRDLQARAEDPALPAVRRALLRPVQVAAGGVDHDADALLQPAVVAGVYHQVGQAGPVDADPAHPAALPVAPVQRPGTVGHQLLAGGDRPGRDHIAGARTVEPHRVHAAVAGREVTAVVGAPVGRAHAHGGPVDDAILHDHAVGLRSRLVVQRLHPAVRN